MIGSAPTGTSSDRAARRRRTRTAGNRQVVTEYAGRGHQPGSAHKRVGRFPAPAFPTSGPRRRTAPSGPAHVLRVPRGGRRRASMRPGSASFDVLRAVVAAIARRYCRAVTSASQGGLWERGSTRGRRRRCSRGRRACRGLGWSRPGGIGLAPWGTRFTLGDGLALLVVADDGISASGRFVAPVEFMKLRSQRQRGRGTSGRTSPVSGRTARTSPPRHWGPKWSNTPTTTLRRSSSDWRCPTAPTPPGGRTGRSWRGSTACVTAQRLGTRAGRLALRRTGPVPGARTGPSGVAVVVGGASWW